MSGENRSTSHGRIRNAVDVQVGKEVLTRRNRLNLSEHQFASLLDIPHEKLLDCERGRCSVTASMLLRLCSVMDEPVQNFFGTALEGNGKVRSSSSHLLPANDPVQMNEDVAELIRSYSRITDPGVRQRMRHLMRAVVSPDQED